ncbi:MAG: FAD-dependent oxidoreductase [Deltaproteobacteria bacterium]|nr:FAD-dependent oxidoreductase [Deltaproteobacteria bacterium]
MNFSDRPPLSISTRGTQDNHTGRWGEITPFFEEKTAPCRQKCPGNIHIPKFLKLVQEQNLVDAWRIICEENPIPRITGRVCFHPCEEDCHRSHFDQGVGIHQVERFIGDWAFKEGLDHYEQRPAVKEVKVAVIGSGPAGIGCCYHLLKRGYRVSLFEAKPALGGLLRYGIPEYRLPKGVLDDELDMIFTSDMDVHLGLTVGKDVSWQEIRSDFQGIFLGTGAQKPVGPDLEGETSDDVMDGFAFLKTDDKTSFVRPDQKVLILGGGNTAIDVARTVLRLGGLPTILYRRSRAEMPAFEDEIAAAVAEGIPILFCLSPKAILRDSEGVKGLTCVQNRISEAGIDGRPRFVPIERSDRLIEGDRIISAFGRLADIRAIPSGIKGEKEGVVVTEHGSCSTKGFFAGGDLTPSPRSVIHALASGKRAASGLDAYFSHQEGGGNDGDRPRPLVDLEDINRHYFQKASRKIPFIRPPGERASDFDEIESSFLPEAAFQEALRCFGCGTCNTCGNCEFFCPDMAVCLDSDRLSIRIDETYCKGCCICVEECPRGVLSIKDYP